MFYIHTRYCAVVTLCSFVVNVCDPSHVARHQFMIWCTEAVEKDISSFPKGVLQNKRQNMTKARRNNQVEESIKRNNQSMLFVSMKSTVIL